MDKIYLYLITTLLSLSFIGCIEETLQPENDCTKFFSLIDDNTTYAIDLPPHVIRAVRSGGYYDESLNLIDLPSSSRIESFIDDNKAKLGRVLFYDKVLSVDNTVSCASCHIQENSFAEPRSVSEGINNLLGDRNAMNLENVIFYPSSGGYGWGEGSAILEDQIKAAILNPKEMGMTEDGLLNKVLSACYYDGLFFAAYQDSTIKPKQIYEALAHFIGSMTAYDTKYDLGRSQVNNAESDFPNFTPLENAGKSLFIENCGICHSLEVFKGAAPSNIGLDLNYEDPGLGGVTGNPSDYGKFKTPSLRNIMVTAPYMHDGRFNTIDEVLEFYSEKIKPHANLDSRLIAQNGSAIKLNFEDFEIEQLKAFLNTLTDEGFLSDEKYADPF